MENTLGLTDRQERLFNWIKEMHGDQRRKYGDQIYWKHLLRVADLASAFELSVGTMEVGLAHDLLEDTGVTEAELIAKLLELEYTPKEAGWISQGVQALTDVFTSEAYPDLNRAERKRREASRLGRIYPQWQSIKYADLIDNTSSIIIWDPEFAKTYIPEKVMILDRMRQGNIELLIMACAEVHAAQQMLNHYDYFDYDRP